MRTGDTFREKNEQVYIKVDSTVRKMQAYRIAVTTESLPYNKVKLLHSKIETLINPNGS